MIVQLDSISKRFGNKSVLTDVTFSVGLNEIIGIIGPNGSGKTTLLNIIMGLVKPNSGTIKIQNKDRINAAVSRNGFFNDVTVLKNLSFYAYLNEYPNSEVEEILDLFDLGFKNEKFGNLSAGMKQRVALANAFMGDSSLILLDEPTNHLDIDSILRLRSIIEDRKRNGTSFLIASHILTELEKLCDRVLFIRQGKIVNAYTMREIEQNFQSLEEAYLKISVQ